MAPPSGFTNSFPASITTAGEANGILISLPNNAPTPPTILKVGVFGIYGSVTLVVRAHLQGSTSTQFYAISGVNVDTNVAVQTGGTIVLTDNTSYLFKLPVAGFDQIEIYASAIGSGSVSVEISTSAAETVSPPIVNSTISTAALTGPVAITGTTSQALTVGANGATNPVLQVDASAGSVATGLDIVGAAQGSGLALTLISSGSNETLTINSKGTGGITLNNTATGTVTVGSSLTVSAVNIITDTTTGTKIGTATTQKLGFYNAAPIVQPANTVDYVTMLTNLGLRATGGTASATFPGAVTALSFLASGTAGVGYATGAGGTVTQITSRTTGVTLSKTTGQITLVSAAGSATPFTFTVTNTLVAATDTVSVSQVSGTDKYSAVVSAVTGGTFNLTITDLTGTTTETPVFNFNILKGATS